MNSIAKFMHYWVIVLVCYVRVLFVCFFNLWPFKLLPEKNGRWEFMWVICPSNNDQYFYVLGLLCIIRKNKRKLKYKCSVSVFVSVCVYLCMSVCVFVFVCRGVYMFWGVCVCVFCLSVFLKRVWVSKGL